MTQPTSRGLSKARRTAEPLPPRDRPLVIAHRGASSDVAEHTLPAYLAAIASGADGLECDVRLTRDGHLVCVHDRTVDRTSNGSGIVSELDLSALSALDFRSWKNAESGSYLDGVEPDRVEADGSQVLTLQALLDVVVTAGRPLRLLIETKHPTRYGGMVEKELVRTLARAGLESGRRDGARVTVMSFAPVALRRVRLLAPALPLVLLMDRFSPIRRDGSLPLGVRTGGPGVRPLRGDPGYVERAHAHGNRVYCWTVDEPRDVSLVTRLGVDAVITNRPAAVIAQLDDTRS